MCVLIYSLKILFYLLLWLLGSLNPVLYITLTGCLLYKYIIKIDITIYIFKILGKLNNLLQQIFLNIRILKIVMSISL